MASRADRHALYERAVQQPTDEVERFMTIYEQLRGRAPMVLREDFCGTAQLSAAWCRKRAGHRAIGVDIDAPTLEWARRRYGKLGERLELIEGDVRRAVRRKADLTCAMNFSFCVFKQRQDLLAYLKSAREGLRKHGVLLLEIYGGFEAMQAIVEERDCGKFSYVWEQERFCPLTHETLCHIHFEFPDGSRLSRAFTYDWRLWTVPELRDLMVEAGFADVRTFWEPLEEDPQDEDMMVGTGVFEEVRTAENQESFLVYVVGLR